MIDLDEMVKRNQGKDFTTPQTTSYAETHHIPTPHTLEEYNAVIAKIAPVETKVSKASKEKRKFHFNKRLLIGLALITVALVAIFGGLVAFGGIGGTGPIHPTTGSSITPTCADLQWNVIDVKSGGPGSQNGTWSGNATATKTTDKNITVTRLSFYWTFTDTAGVTFDRGLQYIPALPLTLTAPVTVFGITPVGYSYQTFNANFTTTFNYASSQSITCNQMVHYLLPNGGW